FIRHIPPFPGVLASLVIPGRDPLCRNPLTVPDFTPVSLPRHTCNIKIVDVHNSSQDGLLPRGFYPLSVQTCGRGICWPRRISRFLVCKALIFLDTRQASLRLSVVICSLALQIWRFPSIPEVSLIPAL